MTMHAEPTRGGYGKWRDKADWSSQILPSRNEHDYCRFDSWCWFASRSHYVISYADPVLSSCNRELDNVDWSVWIPLNRMEHEWCWQDGDPTSSGYNHWSKVQHASLLYRWFNSMKCKFACVFLFSRWDLDGFHLEDFNLTEILEYVQSTRINCGVLQGWKQECCWRQSDDCPPNQNQALIPDVGDLGHQCGM